MMQEQEYFDLLQLLVKMAEANVGKPVLCESVESAEGLLRKCVFHALSAVYLYRGTNLRDKNISVTDFASIDVVARAMIESVLVFFYLFISPKNDDEKDFRHQAWVMADLMCRQKFKLISEEGQTLLAHEENQIEELKIEIKKNPYFLALSNKQKHKILDGKWRLDSWAHISLEMGLDKTHARTFYSYLCSYSHSGFLSILQINQVATAELQKEPPKASLEVLMIAMANMAIFYGKVFTLSQAILQQLPKEADLVQKWSYVGRGGENTPVCSV